MRTARGRRWRGRPRTRRPSAIGSADHAQTKGRHVGLEARALGARIVLGPTASAPFAKESVDGFHYSKMAVCLKGFPGPASRNSRGRPTESWPARDPGGGHEEHPACLSRAVIQGTLRREYRFEGLVFMDAVAALGGGPEILERSANAGVDVILSPPDP